MPSPTAFGGSCDARAQQSRFRDETRPVRRRREGEPARRLDRHRDVVLWKLEGLTDERLRRPMVVIGEPDLEAVGTAWHGATFTLRWVLIHTVEELARHAGHLDILRELLDGATGDHRPDGGCDRARDRAT